MNCAELFGQNLREMRSQRGLSQEQLALEARLDLSYVSDIERGKRNLSLSSILKLSRALGCKVVDLLVGMDEAEPMD